MPGYRSLLSLLSLAFYSMLRRSQDSNVNGTYEVIKYVKPAAWGAFVIALSCELNVTYARSPRSIFEPDTIQIEASGLGDTVRRIERGGDVRSASTLR